MLPSRLFRNRWAALLWAGGVMWTAAEVGLANRHPAARPAAAPTPPAAAQDATGEAVTAADLAALANAGS